MTAETREEVSGMISREDQAREVADRLARIFPGAKTALEYRTPLDLLVATILSAQCTDERVNRVTRQLFRIYRSAADYAAADPATFEEEIKPTGFYRQKTKAVTGMARMLVERFGGEVPSDMDRLVELPGVGRKTASIVLGEAFGLNQGLAVDTHVLRVSYRLGLTERKDAEKVEKDLMASVPRERWSEFSNLLILHGRNTCTSRKPKCAQCALNDICPSAFKVG